MSHLPNAHLSISGTVAPLALTPPPGQRNCWRIVVVVVCKGSQGLHRRVLTKSLAIILHTGREIQASAGHPMENWDTDTEPLTNHESEVG